MRNVSKTKIFFESRTISIHLKKFKPQKNMSNLKKNVVHDFQLTTPLKTKLGFGKSDLTCETEN